ncbi:MAG: NAD-dependent dihydropyrimidine dehydrogenase subunit PreA [Spirochaetales bacterium]|nr:NAD-dependent dihydropyrimidine dehydrogenase subunit PreA [Spirochaetales bacterium]
MVHRIQPEIRSEIASCAMCHDAPCNGACNAFSPGRFLQALRLDDLDLAVSMLPEKGSCPDLDSQLAKAGQVCPMNVDLSRIVSYFSDNSSEFEGTQGYEDIDLSCDICGVRLENPFLLSSSVVCSNYEMCARAFEMGWAGVSFKTICLLDIHEASPRFSVTKSSSGQWSGFKNIEQLSDHSLEENMGIFRALKRNYPSKVIVASIMGRNEDEWTYLAKKVTEAGADVIELNFSCPNMEAKGTGSDVGQDPDACRRYTAAARRGSALPILAKMTPNITDICVPARASVESGANGIAAINTIKSITGVNVDTLVGLPSVHGRTMVGGYSGAAVKPIALRFMSELASDPALKGIHLSGMGGVYTWRDALEFLLMGASSIQVTTSVMEYGYRIIDDLKAGLQIYMAQRNYRSVSELVGLSLGSLVSNDSMERDTVVFPIVDKERCIGCGRCYISCRDGGHQALEWNPVERTVKLDGRKCVGCQLCSLVCPAEAILPSKRISRVGRVD